MRFGLTANFSHVPLSSLTVNFSPPFLYPPPLSMIQLVGRDGIGHPRDFTSLCFKERPGAQSLIREWFVTLIYFVCLMEKIMGISVSNDPILSPNWYFIQYIATCWVWIIVTMWKWKQLWLDSSNQLLAYLITVNFNPWTPKMWLLILPSNCFAFPYKLVTRIWC